MKRPRIYISGPITRGNHADNYWEFSNTFQRLVDLGCAPFNPGNTMTFPGNHLIPHEVWMEVDLPWVEVADAVFRITGDSVGADMECELAREKGIEVFVSTADLLVWMESRRAVP